MPNPPNKKQKQIVKKHETANFFGTGQEDYGESTFPALFFTMYKSVFCLNEKRYARAYQLTLSRLQQQ